MTELMRGTAKNGSSWYKAIVGGFTLQILLMPVVRSFVESGLVFYLIVTVAVVSIAASRLLLTRGDWVLRDIFAFVPLVFLGLVVVLNVLEVVVSDPTDVAGSALASYLLVLPCAMVVAYAALLALHRSDRVSYLG